MNIVIWALAGALLGWASYSYLSYNEARGKLASMAIGAVGALLGGNVIAPMFTAAPAVPAAFSAATLVIAAVVAAVALVVGNLVYTRWGV